MKVNDIHAIMNSVTNEVLGKTDLVAEDLSNIVDVGKEVYDTSNVDNYVKSLIDEVGKYKFDTRVYKGSTPSLVRDSWEYGAVLEKLRAELPEAQANESWNLENGKSYPTDVFYKPNVSAKFFNNKQSFEIPMSFTERQIKESFTSVSQLNSLLTMIRVAIQNGLTVKTESLIRMALNNMIANTIAADIPDVTDNNYSGKTGIKAVNLLKLYNDRFNTTLTADQALTTPEFIRFANFTIGTYKDRLAQYSTLFNVGKKERFTSADSLSIILLSDFANVSKYYLEADTEHNSLVSLPNAETVAFWQASGQDFGFGHTSEIHTTIKDGASTKEINATGILGVMFDKDAVMVCNENQRVTSDWNARGEFTNEYYKFDCSYFNDLDENFVVFFIA